MKDGSISWKVSANGKKTKYEVNNFGIIRNRHTHKIVSQNKDKRGYPRVCLIMFGIIKTETVHRIVGYAFIPNDDPKNKNTIDHDDNDKENNTPSNLSWMSSFDNSSKSHKDGRHKYPKGENAFYSKYTDIQIHEACRLMTISTDYDEISEITGVSTASLKKFYQNKHREDIVNLYEFKKRNPARYAMSEETAKAICKDLEKELSVKKIANKYNVDVFKVGGIKRRETFKNISKHYIW